MGVRERLKRKKPAGRYIILAFSLKSGKHKCLKAKHGVIGYDCKTERKNRNKELKD